MGKKNFFSSTMPFSPWAVLPPHGFMWELLRKYRKNEFLNPL
jgi:hypothetical protein